MKNTVTFETAQRLKNAGFPQPMPEAGQVWYANDVNMRVSIVHVSGRAVNHVNQGYMLIYNTPIREFKTDCVFAPTATDILAQMPDGYSLVKFSGNLFVCTNDQLRIVAEFKYVLSDNPAEAAALAWLKLNEKNPG